MGSGVLWTESGTGMTLRPTLCEREGQSDGNCDEDE